MLFFFSTLNISKNHDSFLLLPTFTNLIPVYRENFIKALMRDWTAVSIVSHVFGMTIIIEPSLHQL